MGHGQYDARSDLDDDDTDSEEDESNSDDVNTDSEDDERDPEAEHVELEDDNVDTEDEFHDTDSEEEYYGSGNWYPPRNLSLENFHAVCCESKAQTCDKRAPWPSLEHKFRFLNKSFDDRQKLKKYYIDTENRGQRFRKVSKRDNADYR